MSRKPCGRPTSSGPCGYERAPARQRCRWHWLMAQPADVQERHASVRLSSYLEGGFPQRPRRPQSEWPPGERWCAGCQSFVPLFYTSGSRCKSCASVAAHASRVASVYGISGDDYGALLRLQGGRCYICQRRALSKRLAVDHNHATGRVRGLLCADNERGCNHAILGNIRDLEMAKRIVRYLEDPPYERLIRGDRTAIVARPRVNTKGGPPEEDPPF